MKGFFVQIYSSLLVSHLHVLHSDAGKFYWGGGSAVSG